MAATPCSDKIPLHVKRCGPSLHADKSRVLLRRLYPSSHDIARRIVDRILEMPEAARNAELEAILDEFANRHNDVRSAFAARFREVRGNVGERWTCSESTKTLVGAHFMHEYSIESAALFNPSIVPHPDQSGLPPGSTRFVLSLRATGEGHISSVTFREGVVNAHNRVSLERSLSTITEANLMANTNIVKRRLCDELRQSHGVAKTWSPNHQQVLAKVVAELGDEFSVDELRRACSHVLSDSPGPDADATCQAILLVAEANYSVQFQAGSALSQRVLFPSAPSQSNGIEDARFVRFTDTDGSVRYYATFTAYNGRSILPQLMITDDFLTFRFVTLIGHVSNKGFALFPRRVNDRYWMLSRQDDENILIMSSETMLKWEDPVVLVRPAAPWEMFKLGNCGSPIETPKGWLVITHGVGPMRRYCLGAAMLDLNDPTKIIGRLAEPLIAPNEEEREGYVPNVVYTCGAMLHNNSEVIVPYAMSDSTSSFATVALTDLYRAMGIC